MTLRMSQRVLDAVRAALVGNTAAGASVRLDQVDEIPAADLPALDINGRGETLTEAITRLTMDDPALQQHVLTFTVASFAIDPDASAAASAARALAGDVEAVLLATGTAPVKVDGSPIELQCVAVTEAKEAGDRAVVRVAQTWQATYHTYAGQPGTPA